MAGVGKSRGPKTVKLDAFALAEKLRIGSLETRVYKNRGQFRRLGDRAKSYDFLVSDTVRVKNRLKSVLRSRGVAYGAGRSVYLKRDREGWLAKLPEASRANGRVAVRGARRTRGIEGEGREGVAGGSTQASRVACAEDVPGSGSDPNGGAPAGGGDAVPVPEPEQILGVLRTGRGDAELVGLGAGSGWAVGKGTGTADAGAESELQPHAEACVQGRGDDGDRSSRKRTLVPPLRATPGGGHEAESGEADDRASARLDRASGVAHGRSVRPQETGSDGVNRAGIGERGVESGHNMGSDETEANRLQGTASIHTVGRGREPKPPIKGYAPLESRTKRWATESQIEGWFPLQSGERDGCERLPDCDADPASAPLPTLSRRPGNPNHADADGQKMSRRRVGKVRLDRQPHRRVCKKRGEGDVVHREHRSPSQEQ